MGAVTAWGESWGVSWGHSWDIGESKAVEEGIKPSGGIPAQEWRPFEERDPYRFSQQVRQIIEEVAVQQVQLSLDEPQILPHLIEELKAENIEFETQYLEALNGYREILIREEIKSLLKSKDDNEAMLLILIAANLT